MKAFFSNRVVLILISVVIIALGFTYISSASLPYLNATPKLIFKQLSQLKKADIIILIGLVLLFYALHLFIIKGMIYCKNRFITIFYVTLAVCVIISLYCIVNGHAMASTHLEPQYLLRDLQLAIAAIIGVALLWFKQMRKVMSWYFIPVILASFSIFYVFIVNQFPCCIGG